ncbi:unnamed protein product [Durusdinium trenchii]|uniref:Uncharacterized protein n=1 Tax=Durusdinium trenchii TaxID=1381693 RepID=A0ABP0JCW4_9DINO
MIDRQTITLLPLISLQLVFAGCCMNSGVRWPHGLACHRTEVAMECDEAACVQLPATVNDYNPEPAPRQPRAPEPPPEGPGLHQPTPASPPLPEAPSFDDPLPQSNSSETTPPGLIPLANAAKQDHRRRKVNSGYLATSIVTVSLESIDPSAYGVRLRGHAVAHRQEAG